MLDGNTLTLLLPEIALVVLAAVVIVGGTFGGQRSTWIGVAAAAFVLAILAYMPQRGVFLVENAEPSGPLLIDSLGGTLRWMSLGLGFLFVLTMARGAKQSQTTEFLGLVLLVFAGLLVVCWAGNLVLLFLGLELISVPTYALLFLGSRNKGAAESSAKYFFLSILSSAIFLFGVGLLFGVAGSLEFATIRLYFGSGGQGGGPAASIVVLSLLFMFAGLGFKIAAVPFHFYAPDVYQATSNGNAGLLAVVPKIAGIVALVRLLAVLLPAGLSLTWQLTVIVSLLTMTIGNVTALWQNNIRRLMAYSSIAHAGYMLIGLAVASAATSLETPMTYSGFSATLLYLVLYSIASLGAFAVLCEISGDSPHEQINEVQQLAGLSKQRPWMAAALAVCMFSLAGIPPLAGFWGKLTLFTGALSTARGGGTLGSGSTWFIVLAVAGVVNAAIAAAYYLRLVGVAYFADVGPAARPSLSRTVGTAAWSAATCAVLLIAAGVFPRFAVERFHHIGGSLQPNRAAATTPIHDAGPKVATIQATASPGWSTEAR